MVGILVSSWNGLFSGAMLVSGSVYNWVVSSPIYTLNNQRALFFIAHVEVHIPRVIFCTHFGGTKLCCTSMVYHLERIDGDRHSHERLGLSWPRKQIATQLGSGDRIPSIRTHYGVIFEGCSLRILHCFGLVSYPMASMYGIFTYIYLFLPLKTTKCCR